jgi:hypothetical protein
MVEVFMALVREVRRTVRGDAFWFWPLMFLWSAMMFTGGLMWGFAEGEEMRPVLTSKPIEPPKVNGAYATAAGQRSNYNVMTIGNNTTGIAIAGVASGAGTNIGFHASAYGGVNNHAALFDGDVVVKGKLIMEGYKCVPTK